MISSVGSISSTQEIGTSSRQKEDLACPWKCFVSSKTLRGGEVIESKPRIPLRYSDRVFGLSRALKDFSDGRACPGG